MIVGTEFRRFLSAAAAAITCGGCYANPTGNTPLILAAYRGDLTKVEQLLSSGANVNASNREGVTPLIASTWGNVEVGKTLIAKGANVNAGDVNGRTALMEAAAQGNLEFVQLLLNSGSDVNAELRLAPVHPSPHSQTMFPGTALQEATMGGRVDVMKALMSHGANVNATNQLGQTALMLACRGGCPPVGACRQRKEMVSMLLAAGADVNANDYCGHTALSGFVIGGTGEENLELKKLLRDAGATEPTQRSPNTGPPAICPAGSAKAGS